MKLELVVKAAMTAGLVFAAPASAQSAKPPAGAVTAPVPREAAAVVDAFHAALGRGDTAGAAALLASDALIYESGRAERSKAEYASHHLPADAAFAKGVRRTVTRRSGRAEGGAAWIATETTAKGSYKGRAINSIGTETMVLRREGRAWRIVHIHWSSADVK